MIDTTENQIYTLFLVGIVNFAVSINCCPCMAVLLSLLADWLILGWETIQPAFQKAVGIKCHHDMHRRLCGLAVR